MPRRACPERSRRGQPIIAQRFSAGKGGKKRASPGGTTEFSRTLFNPRGISAPPIPTPCHLATVKVLCHGYAVVPSCSATPWPLFPPLIFPQPPCDIQP